MTISGTDILVIKGKNYPQETYTLYLSSMSISGDRFDQDFQKQQVSLIPQVCAHFLKMYPGFPTGVPLLKVFYTDYLKPQQCY